MSWSRCPKSSPASAKRASNSPLSRAMSWKRASRRSTLRQLTKFAGSGGGLTINFDAMLLGERVFWDPATDTLTIKGTPPNLRDQLQRRTSGGN
nr:nucleoid-associated protein [Klebsiella pneumoniae]